MRRALTILAICAFMTGPLWFSWGVVTLVAQSPTGAEQDTDLYEKRLTIAEQVEANTAALERLREKPRNKDRAWMDTYKYQQMIQRIESVEADMAALEKKHASLLQRFNKEQKGIRTRRSIEVKP